jgi:hypothetical protein
VAENVTLTGPDLSRVVDSDVLRIDILLPEQVEDLYAAADSGDAGATIERLTDIVDTILDQINEATSQQNAPLGCQLCRAPFWAENVPLAFMVGTMMRSASAKRAHGFHSGICALCCERLPSREDMTAAVEASLQEQFILVPLPDAGHG